MGLNKKYAVFYENQPDYSGIDMYLTAAGDRTHSLESAWLGGLPYRVRPEQSSSCAL